MGHERLRRDLIATARRMNAIGINQGKSGNASVRVRDGFLVTPSALPYAEMTPEDVVLVAMDGTPRGLRRPSTEWRIHRDVYASRPEAGAVLHAHSIFSTALACLRRDIPAFHYMVAVAGGASIRCAPYARFGTQELSDHALRAIYGRKACLLANHGLIALGPTLKEALALAVEVETLAATYLRALQVGEPHVLSDEEMAGVLRSFEDYRPDAAPSRDASGRRHGRRPGRGGRSRPG